MKVRFDATGSNSLRLQQTLLSARLAESNARHPIEQPAFHHRPLAASLPCHPNHRQQSASAPHHPPPLSRHPQAFTPKSISICCCTSAITPCTTGAVFLEATSVFPDDWPSAAWRSASTSASDPPDPPSGGVIGMARMLSGSVPCGPPPPGSGNGNLKWSYHFGQVCSVSKVYRV